MPASATADSLARSVPRSTMDQLRNDSQRKAESTSAHRVALGQQQELEPESLEQQLKGNEACGYERGTIGVLSQAIEGARLYESGKSLENVSTLCVEHSRSHVTTDAMAPSKEKSLFWWCT